MESKSYKNYWPLASLILISAAVATAIIRPMDANLMAWMHYFMGFFLCAFAMLKIFTPKAFVNGFMMYDLIAKRSRGYAYTYPYIELALGLGYLSFFAPEYVYAATIIVMLISAAGVLVALKNGLNVNCPCMGSVLKVPLSTVTLSEDVIMGVMAAWMLLR